MDTFIGHITALRLLDQLGPDASPLPTTTLSQLPNSTPTDEDVERFLSVAKSLGATVPPNEKVELIVPEAASRLRLKNAELHVWSERLPRGSFLRLAHDLLVASPCFALQLVAASLPLVESRRLASAQAEWSARTPYGVPPLSVDPTCHDAPADTPEARAHRRAFLETIKLVSGACGSYGMYPLVDNGEPTANSSGYRRRAPLCSVEELRRHVEDARGLHGVGLLRQALPLVIPGSASPMETALAMLLFLPTWLGGYGIGAGRPDLRPQRNFRIAKPAYLGQRHPGGQSVRDLPDECCYFVDLAIPSVRLAIEYNGLPGHSDPAKRAKDEARRNDLIRLGWTVITVMSWQLSRTAETERLARSVAACMGCRLRTRLPDFRLRQQDLRRIVLPRVNV